MQSMANRKVTNFKISMGMVNEEMVRLTISSLLNSLGIEFKMFMHYKVYSPVLERNTDIDVLLITPYDIYCIEVKSFKVSLCGRYNEPMWVGKSKTTTTPIYNPFFQNKEHIRSLKYYMRRKGLTVPNIENIVCCTTNIFINVDQQVYTLYQLGGVFRKSMTNEKVIDVDKYYRGLSK